ncbi:MAG: hypothetical protein A2020_02385 [Lentisphaerae bacterium GWF2_45_14]|nr:MAG: hypothetical protein A2020_02385 [Lentisphaerae bacterium GWF2_45_14]
MKLKIIACKVFQYELEYCSKSCAEPPDIEFLEIGEHAHPVQLREKLQKKIDEIASASETYDAIALAYGLCGRAVDRLQARREKLVVPRSHDCCGILLGSRKKFEEYFREMPSTPFSSPGYVESGSYFFQDGEMLMGDGYQALVEQYGEDNAKYIYESMHPKLDGILQPVYYIDTPEMSMPGLMRKCMEKAKEEGREFKILEGNLRLITMLLNGPWPDEEFLTLPPGKSIQMTTDWDKIITATD